MKYDGTEVRQGDRVLISNGDSGVVVVSVDTDEFSPEFPKEYWSDELETGVMVQTERGALVHFESSSELMRMESS